MIPKILQTVQPKQVWIGDRNFCTCKFLEGLIERNSRFLLRQHASTVRVEERETLQFVGQTDTGKVFEQRVRLTNLIDQPEVRRVVLQLDKPTRNGEKEIRLLTNLPASVASAIQVATRYPERGGIEKLFQRLTVVLNAEVRPLGYPQAALFGFAVALVVSNAFSVVMEALQAVHPKQPIREELSYYQVGLELQQSKKLLETVAEEIGESLREMAIESFAGWLKELAGKVQWEEYRKTHRGPKQPRPERPKCPRYRHVSTKKLLDQQRGHSP
jgi:hypothetical protein